MGLTPTELEEIKKQWGMRTRTGDPEEGMILASSTEVLALIHALEKAWAERDRYREALTVLANEDPDDFENTCCGCSGGHEYSVKLNKYTWKIAQEALQSEKKEPG